MRKYLTVCWLVALGVLGLSSAGLCLTLTDGWQRTVVFDRPVERIVSLSPANTEIIYFLELDHVLAGVTSYCNYPPEVNLKEVMGTLTEVDLERVVTLQPDLVLAGSLTSEEAVERMASFGLKVFVLNPETVEDVLDAMVDVARIAGIEPEGREKVDELSAVLQSVTRVTEGIPEAERPTVFHVIWHDPPWTVGRGTFIHQLIELTGGKNLAADLSGYATLSLEELLRRRPEVITVVDNHGEADNLPYQFLTTDARLRHIPAVQEGRIYRVDSDVVSRSGPRVAEAVLVFARIFYPELFGDYREDYSD